MTTYIFRTTGLGDVLVITVVSENATKAEQRAREVALRILQRDYTPNATQDMVQFGSIAELYAEGHVTASWERKDTRFDHLSASSLPERH